MEQEFVRIPEMERISLQFNGKRKTLGTMTNKELRWVAENYSIDSIATAADTILRYREKYE